MDVNGCQWWKFARPIHFIDIFFFEEPRFCFLVWGNMCSRHFQTGKQFYRMVQIRSCTVMFVQVAPAGTGQIHPHHFVEVCLQKHVELYIYIPFQSLSSFLSVLEPRGA